MAMAFKQTNAAGSPEILAAPFFQAIPFQVAAPAEGTVVKAGTPLTAAGASTTAAGAVGILLNDVDTEDKTNCALLVNGIVNQKAAEEHSGLTYGDGLTDALNAAGCRITLRDNVGVNENE